MGGAGKRDEARTRFQRFPPRKQQSCCVNTIVVIGTVPCLVVVTAYFGCSSAVGSGFFVRLQACGDCVRQQLS